MVIEADLVIDSIGESPADLLAGLLWDDSIEFYCYADKGAPDSVKTLENFFGDPAPIGWITVSPREEDDWLSSHTVQWCNGESVTEASIARDFYEAAGHVLSRAEKGSADVLVKDTLIVLAAHEMQADLVITRRESLLRTELPMAQGITVVTPDDSLALVGHYLRCSGEFLVWKGKTGKVSLDKGLFYRLAIHEHVPEIPQFLRSCVLVDQQHNSDSLTHLAGAVLQRLSRSLVQRDEVWKAANQPQDRNAAEEALSGLDSCLLFLMAAIDALSRIAHVALEIEGEPHLVGWQKRDWIKKVSKKIPELADLVREGSRGGHTLTILRLLRNAIHGEGLLPLAISAGGRAHDTVVGLPVQDTEKILDAVDSVGDRASWGLRELLPGRIHAHPGSLIEKLLPEVLALVNDLIGAMHLNALHEEGAAEPTELNLVMAGMKETAMRRLIGWQLHLGPLLSQPQLEPRPQ